MSGPTRKGGRPTLARAAGLIHQSLVFSRRCAVLASEIAAQLPRCARVLDIGCGDGTIDGMILQARPDVSIIGVEVLVRASTAIPVTPFDGLHVPYPDASFDVALLVDVLHHASSPFALLREGVRVAPLVVLKDHRVKGRLRGAALHLTDWSANAPHGVALPYNYWSCEQWKEAFRRLRLTATVTTPRLYPRPVYWILGREVDFIARLEAFA